MPKISNIEAAISQSQSFVNSGFSISFHESSSRYKKLIELDSDIRELNDLGLLDHSLKSSKRSSNGFQDLGPIHKKTAKVEDNQKFSQKNVIKYRKSEDSIRYRKIIKDNPENKKKNSLLKTVSFMQNLFRAKRIKK